MNPLISTDELAAILGKPGVRVVDASWRLDKSDMRPAFEAAHIPGAVFFAIDEVSDRDSKLPHMLPPRAQFAEQAGALGIAAADRIVVYDDGVFMSAPRVWWTLRAFGARHVQVLDGGLAKWRAEGRPLESGPARPRSAVFHTRVRPELVRDYDSVLRVVNGEDAAQIVDARPGDRFRAEAPEPREGIRGGHMPGARSLPVGELYADGRLKDAEGLRAAFAAAGVDPAAPVVASCGSGVAAGAVALALAVLGQEDGAVYDGSWTEWGGRGDSPVATGE